MIKTTYSFVGAVLAAYTLGAIFVSQGNIASVVALGFEVSGAQRLDAVVHTAVGRSQSSHAARGAYEPAAMDDACAADV